MGLIDKVKNFFFEDEDEIPVKVKKSSNINVERRNTRPVEVKMEKEEKQEFYNEMFKDERTFNFPIDFDDTPKKTIKKEIKKEVSEVENNKNIEVRKPYNQEENVRNEPSSEYARSRYSSFKSYTKEEKEEPKKFKPTPVISPIFGVLDKNYKKEDIALDATREFNIQKKVDYDTIRKRAYSNVYEEENKEESKSMFFNLENNKDDDFDNTDDEVKIIYNDVTFDEETEDNNVEEENNNIGVDNDGDNEEQDLFNLIDNMYNFEDEEEEDE